jgi:hypothetical protein
MAYTIETANKRYATRPYRSAISLPMTLSICGSM